MPTPAIISAPPNIILNVIISSKNIAEKIKVNIIDKLNNNAAVTVETNAAASYQKIKASAVGNIPNNNNNPPSNMVIVK